MKKRLLTKTIRARLIDVWIGAKTDPTYIRKVSGAALDRLLDMAILQTHVLYLIDKAELLDDDEDIFDTDEWARLRTYALKLKGI